MKYLTLILFTLLFNSCEQKPKNLCELLLNQREREVNGLENSTYYTNEYVVWEKQIIRTDSLILKYCKKDSI